MCTSPVSATPPPVKKRPRIERSASSFQDTESSLPIQYRYLFSPSDPIRLELPSLP